MKNTLHPNGFQIRVLAQFKNGIRIRLHTWSANAPRLDTPHDHRSWFVSIPLWGRFLERRFIRSITGETFEVLRCSSTTGNGKPITKSEGTARLQEKSVCTRWPLIPYFCSSESLHSFVPTSNGFAASLVLFGPSTQVPRAFVKESVSR